MRLIPLILAGMSLTILAACEKQPAANDVASAEAPTNHETAAVASPNDSIEPDDHNPRDEIQDQDPLIIFRQRILPIMQAKNPSSCSECHLSGVDLKDYIRDDQAKTFAALRERGLIDIKNPDQSKLLKFISRKPQQPSLVTQQVRNQELAAFQAWIRAAVQDPKLLASAANDDPLGATLPLEVIRHARRDRVLASFIDNVWSEVGRCAACHSPDRNQKQVKKHGVQVSWIKLRDPLATMNYMIEASLIDAEFPADSLLLTKPTLEVEHGGGQKMVIGDRSYKQFRRFIDDYAAMVNSKYTKADQLPRPTAEVSHVSEIWLKLTDVPERFDKQLLQVDLFRWQDDGWSQTRWATSDRPVFGKGKLWQHSLSLTAPRGSKRAEELRRVQQLPAGKYLLKISIDQTGKLKQDFQAELGKDEFISQVEIDSRWPTGYGRMTKVRFPSPN